MNVDVEDDERGLQLLDLLNLLVVKVDCGYETNAELSGSSSVSINRSYTTTRKEDGTGDGFLSTGSIVRNAFTGEDRVVRQCALVSDSQNEEERSDDLFRLR